MLPKRVSIVRRNRLEGGSDPDARLIWINSPTAPGRIITAGGMSVAQTTKHHADQVQATVARGSAAKSAVVASWRRSSNFHRLDPAECNLPRRLSQAEFELARQQIEPLVRAAQSNLDRLFLAVGGVGCCVLLADRNGVPVDRRGAASDDETFKCVGPVDRDGLERGVRRHQRHRNLSGRAARAHRPSRPAFLCTQHAVELHHGADLRSRGQAGRGARRIVLPRRPDRRIRQSHRGRRRRRRAPDRDGEFPAGVPERALSVCARSQSRRRRR